ncbi:Exodeoxyribonuclease V beta chain [Methanocaldococcus lauensis]|uniref:Exodeoxyribonuclease V beta chain n=1 Tax=Methanocaldococcus lauensis TaxID=2546128 RepID=A0A8D6SZ76_9EURY|nr:hypothetical protein [Methanocaldococcus lauensis]CAB3288001.1 Exodeoxyribonuclease V beta chain [Methanocaldococcus lauensis]
MLDKINYLFLFQNLIKEGNLKIIFKNIFSLTVDKNFIVLNIFNVKTIKELMSAMQIDKKENISVSNILSNIKNISDLMSKVSKIADTLVKNKKTFVLKYNGEDVLIVGYEAKGGIILKNIKIANKLLLIKLLNEFRD